MSKKNRVTWRNGRTRLIWGCNKDVSVRSTPVHGWERYVKGDNGKGGVKHGIAGGHSLSPPEAYRTLFEPGVQPRL